MGAIDLLAALPHGSDAYAALPAPGTGPGVLVLHAWWGLTPFFRGFCDRLAGEGFQVLAPDLYGGATAATIEEAKKLKGKLKQEALKEQILRAAEALSASSAESRGIGLVGFSLGGYWALWLAEQPAQRAAATAVFYGNRGGEYTASRSAFQFHFAESDPYESASGVKRTQKSLEKAGREAAFYTYPGTGHWFFESDRPDAYQPEAAALAWKRLLAFLKTHLMH